LRLDLLLVLRERLLRFTRRLVRLLVSRLQVSERALDVLADLGHPRDQRTDLPALLLSPVVRRLGLPVRRQHLVDGAAGLREKDPRALVDGDAALADHLAERPLHLPPELLHLPVLLLDAGHEALRLFLVLVLLFVVPA